MKKIDVRLVLKNGKESTIKHRKKKKGTECNNSKEEIIHKNNRIMYQEKTSMVREEHQLGEEKHGKRETHTVKEQT